MVNLALAPGNVIPTGNWAGDHYHASNFGYYLEALTIYAAVTHNDPRKLGPAEKAARELGIGSDTAAKLQRVAFDMVRGDCEGG